MPNNISMQKLSISWWECKRHVQTIATRADVKNASCKTIVTVRIWTAETRAEWRCRLHQTAVAVAAASNGSQCRRAALSLDNNCTSSEFVSVAGKGVPSALVLNGRHPVLFHGPKSNFMQRITRERWFCMVDEYSLRFVRKYNDIVS